MFNLKLFSYEECPPEAFRFRYSVYVEELARPQKYADHDAKTIIDPMDRTAHHGVAYKNEHIAAVIRLNFVRDGNVDPYYDFYEINRLSLEEQAVSCICTRNMVGAAHRNTPLAYRMLKLMYELAIENGARICFIDVNEPLVPMFKKLGCRPVMEKQHDDYGLVTIMRLDGLDLDHLIKVRSPFTPICRRFLKRTEGMPVQPEQHIAAE
ncbi:MAG: hypothetical protein AAGD92_11515 [Pseudomonadota bacterium]